MKLKTIVLLLALYCSNLYSQSDIKFIESFTRDIIIDKKIEKYKNYISYYNGFDGNNLSKEYQELIQFMVEEPIYEEGKDIKILNITDNNSLINQKFEIDKNLNHNYYQIYYNNHLVRFVITDEKGKIVSFIGTIIKHSENKISPFYLYEDYTSEFEANSKQ